MLPWLAAACALREARVRFVACLAVALGKQDRRRQIGFDWSGTRRRRKDRTWDLGRRYHERAEWAKIVYWAISGRREVDQVSKWASFLV